jgi:hypothetical protein
MPLGSRANETDRDGLEGAPVEESAAEAAVENISDGAEETLFDDGEVYDYDLGEGD